MAETKDAIQGAIDAACAALASGPPTSAPPTPVDCETIAQQYARDQGGALVSWTLTGDRLDVVTRMPLDRVDVTVVGVVVPEAERVERFAYLYRAAKYKAAAQVRAALEGLPR